MEKTTELTRQDLKILKSQRNTDTPDGGGAMTKEELTGEENELFSPISSVDKVMGALDARLVYATVMRDDDAVLHGANVIISEPPEAKNVSILAIPGDHYAQERASAMERIEGYAVPTIETRMTLLGTQRKGSRLVQVYQRENAPLPVIGQRFALKSGSVYEFFRVESFTSEIRTFEDSEGEFTRRVIQMVTQSALDRDFVGLENASRYGAKPDDRLMNTQIADSAKYYGIKPLKEAAQKDSSSLKIDGIAEKLVPTSTVETAIADTWSQGREMWIQTAPRCDFTVYSGSNPIIYLPYSVLPGSVQFMDYTDDAQGYLKNSKEEIIIDYEKGILLGLQSSSYYRSISAIPAVCVRQYAYSTAIEIDDTNIGTEWVPLLRPKPALGSVSVSYMASREWYELQDPGDGTLRDNENISRGEVTPSGSLLISLPRMPDSGSKIIISWTPIDYYHAFDGSAPNGAAVSTKTITTTPRLPENPNDCLKPGTVRLTWDGGEAQDDSQGNITGGFSGKINYVTGVITPSAPLPAAKFELTAEQFIANRTVKTVSVADGGSVMSMVVGAFEPGSLKIELVVEQKTATGFTVGTRSRLATSSS